MTKTIEKKFINGKIVGTENDWTQSFFGIPYGNLEQHFEVAKEAAIIGDIDATNKDNIYCCTQKRTYHKPKVKVELFYHNEFREGINFKYSALNCLNLNIFTPKDAVNCPIIFYVHGGSFVMCSDNEKPFSGIEYTKRGIILVNINYRLNIFGFYADKTHSNLALQDISLALQWVKHNIKTFGGDPSNITVMGQSAGAMMLQSLILQDSFKNEIKGAILLSGGGITNGIFAPKSKKFSSRFFKMIFKESKVNNFIEFSKLSDEQLFKLWEKVSSKHLITSMLSTMPVYDDFIKKITKNKLSKENQIPCIISITKNDMQPRKYLEKSALNYSKICNSNIWRYQFNHDLPGDNNGSWHSSDLWYAFGNFSQSWRPFQQLDIDISNDLIDLFSSFVKTQTPTNSKYFTLHLNS